MKMLRQIALFWFIVALLKLFWQMPAFAMLVLPSEIRKLKFTGGEGEFRCQFGHKIGETAAAPLAASGLLFGTGLVALGSWSWLKRRGQAPATA